MKARLFFLSVLVIVLLGCTALPVQADGIIIPDPCPPSECPQPLPVSQLAVRYHHVEVEITDQVAVTRIDQVFYNPNDWTVEGTYVFPLPLDAAVSNFKLWIDGEAVEGQVLDAETARETYEQIVATMQDPALLEYVGQGAVQARIFPIPPEGERRIQLEYTQVLTAENGLVQYVYPLNTERFSVLPLESVSVKVSIQSDEPIRAVYSPSHTIATSSASDNQVTASYEEANVTPDQDFALYYSIGEAEAFHLMTYRNPDDPADPDGFFMMLLAPRPDAAAEVASKDVVLVLDSSGSMEGEKFTQVQTAARYVLEHLNADDRFAVISFNSSTLPYSRSLSGASGSAAAVSWINGLSAGGSTDINRALLEAASLVDEERPTYLIFLTDGLPTEGVLNSAEILANFSLNAPDNLRLFAFGVGYDVDTVLLDSLTQEHSGRSTYIAPGEALDEILSSFYAGISMPVLTDLELEIDGVEVSDVYPRPLPDLFSGSQIVVTGRYRGGGTADVTLRGTVNGQEQTFHYANQKFVLDSEDGTGPLANIPRLWATRKVGWLLNQIRLNGPDAETIDQIVSISVRYGIVTPYTSYLVTEPSVLGAAAQNSVAQEAYDALNSAPAPATSGAVAVERAADQGQMESAEAPVAVSEEYSSQVKVLGARTFVLQDGVWIDTAFDAQTMQTEAVRFLSQRYFELAEEDASLAAAFSLGQHVIVISNGMAYEVTTDVVEPLRQLDESGK